MPLAVIERRTVTRRGRRPRAGPGGPGLSGPGRAADAGGGTQGRAGPGPGDHRDSDSALGSDPQRGPDLCRALAAPRRLLP